MPTTTPSWSAPPESMEPAEASGGPMTMTSRQIALVAVSGELDESGLDQLRNELEGRLRRPEHDIDRCLAVDLSGVTRCPPGLLALLADIYVEAQYRGGWMRLVGLGDAVLAALDSARLPEVLTVYLASDWKGVGQTSAENLIAATRGSID